MKPIFTEQKFDCWYCDTILKITCKWKPGESGYFVCPFCGGSDSICNGIPVSVTDMQTGKTTHYDGGVLDD